MSTEELESLGENLKSMLAKSVSNGAGATEVADLEMPASPPREPLPQMQFIAPPPPLPQAPVEPSLYPSARNPKNGRFGAAGAPESKEKSFRKPNFFRGALDAIVPTAERVKFYRRDELGQVKLVPRSYTPKDLEVYSDIEEFIVKHLTPTYGSGEYNVALVNSKGEETRSAAIHVLANGGAPPSESSAALEMLNRHIERLQHQIDEKERRDMERKEPTMHERLAEIQSLKQTLGLDEKKGDSGATMALMMLMMQQQQQGRGPSPEIAEMRAELRALGEEMKRMASAPVALPPLPPPPEPINVPGLVKEIASIVRPTEQPQKQGMGIGEILGLVQTAAPILKSLLGVDQVNGIAEQIKQLQERTTSSKSLQDTLQDLRLFNNVMREVGGGGGGSDTFGAAVAGLLENLPQTLEAVGSLMQKSQPAVPQPQARQARPALPPRARPGGPAALPPRARPVSAQAAPLPPAAPVQAAPAEQDPALEGGDDDDDGLDFPPGIERFTKKLASATDPKVRIVTTLTMLQFCNKQPAWNKQLREVLTAAREGDLDTVREFFGVVLAGLADSDMITSEVRDQTLRDLEENLAEVVKIVTAGK